MTPIDTSLIRLRQTERQAKHYAALRYTDDKDFRRYSLTCDDIEFTVQHLPAQDAIDVLLSLCARLKDKHYGSNTISNTPDSSPQSEGYAHAGARHS